MSEPSIAVRATAHSAATYDGGYAVEELARRVGQLLLSQGWTVGLAESCTGGLVSKLLTDVSGSSRYVRGTVVAYANEAKISMLGVPASTIADLGAVSEQVAIQMAIGAAQVFGSEVGRSVTGIAVPGGGAADKPVGTVWFGLHSPGGTRGECARYAGGRAVVREAAARHAVLLLTGVASGGPAVASTENPKGPNG